MLLANSSPTVQKKLFVAFEISFLLTILLSSLNAYKNSWDLFTYF